MRKLKKKYENPLMPWDKARIDREKELMNNYGLKKKQELWRTEALLKKFRRMARSLIARRDEVKEKALIEKLAKLGVLKTNSTLDDVLVSTVENFLERRLQTVVFRKGLANSIKQARQLITHGHVKINGRKVVYPSYMVPTDEGEKMQVK